MRRPSLLLVLTAVMGLVLAACGSPSESASPGASSAGDSSASSAAEPSQAAASQGGAGGGGGGGGGGGLTLSDGSWSSGSAHVVASGDLSATIDADLFPQTSYTADGNTVLTYLDADSGSAVTIAIYPDEFAVSVTSGEVVGGAGTTTTCEVTYNRGDDNAVDATFQCPNAAVISGAGVALQATDLDGSFTANR